MRETGKRLNGRIDGTNFSQSSCALAFNTLIRPFADFVGDTVIRRALYSSSTHIRPSHLAMTAVLRTFVSFFFSLSITLALPSNLEKPPQAIEAVNSTAPAASLTASNPFREYDVDCLNTRITPTLVPSDCVYVSNDLVLTPDVLRERRFKSNSYDTDGGNYAPSQWRFETCEATVVGHQRANMLLTLYDVALTVDKIVRQCVGYETYHKGGLCLIGDTSKGFHVIVRAFTPISAKNSTISQRPAVGVSRRTIRSQHDLETATGELVTRDPLSDVSRVSNHVMVRSNSTLSVAASPRYPVHCFVRISEFFFPLLSHILSPETCLGLMYSLDVFQGSLYPLRQAILTPKS